MKYTLLTLLLGLTFSLNAQDAPKPKGPPEPPQRPALTEEQKKVRKEMLDKYDSNKNGRLEREEMKKVTEEDRKKMREATPAPRQGGPKKEEQPPKK